MNNFEDIFSIKIFRKQIDVDVVTKIKQEMNLCCDDDIYSLMQGNTFNQQNQPVFSDPNFEEDFLEKNKINSLREEALKNCYEYLNEYDASGSNSLTFQKSWVCFCPRDCWGHSHNHPESLIAGVYYFKTNNSKGNLRLWSPLQFKKGVSHIKYDIEPEEGTMVLFPGWMYHEILTNTGEETRVSIAFQVAW
jgi:uncharacterized protein (TIGR02466 family)